MSNLKCFCGSTATDYDVATDTIICECGNYRNAVLEGRLAQIMYEKPIWNVDIRVKSPDVFPAAAMREGWSGL